MLLACDTDRLLSFLVGLRALIADTNKISGFLTVLLGDDVEAETRKWNVEFRIDTTLLTPGNH